jgi:hypothetical protein
MEGNKVALSNADRQRRFRERRALPLRPLRPLRRNVTLWEMLLEIKEEVAALRNELHNAQRNDQALKDSPKRTGSVPKEHVLIPNLIRSLDSEGDEIYQLYPRHVAKLAFLRAYRTARKQASFDAILDAVRKFAIECQTLEAKFIPHPATWINKGRWLDEEPNRNGNGLFGSYGSVLPERDRPPGPAPSPEDFN